MDFDKILEDKNYQAEFDKRVDKAIKTATDKLQETFNKTLSDKLAEKEAEIVAKQKEIEDNAKLTESEKHQKELAKIAKERDELVSYKSKREMIDKARAHIKEKAYDSSIEDLLDLGSFKDEAEMTTKLEEANNKFTSKVSESLNNKLKENGYSDLADKAKGAAGKKDEFNFNFTPVKAVEPTK